MDCCGRGLREKSGDIGIGALVCGTGRGSVGTTIVCTGEEGEGFESSESSFVDEIETLSVSVVGSSTIFALVFFDFSSIFSFLKKNKFDLALVIQSTE